MYKLCFYVPQSHLESVKAALFSAGAGRLGRYEHCAWQTLGKGQFRPMPGSEPFIGSSGDLEVLDEYQVEMVCEAGCIAEVVGALREAHPYEEPAYAVWSIDTRW